jgi:hypothetical protein
MGVGDSASLHHISIASRPSSFAPRLRACIRGLPSRIAENPNSSIPVGCYTKSLFAARTRSCSKPMDLSPWLILRQASEAVANGRPDDAHRLLAPLVDEGNRKAQRAAREVVKAYCTRAAKQLDQDQPDAAWWDLLAAESLNTGEKCVAELRLTLTRLGLVQARGALEIGDPAAATTVTSRLRERGVRHPRLASDRRSGPRLARCGWESRPGGFPPGDR